MDDSSQPFHDVVVAHFDRQLAPSVETAGRKIDRAAMADASGSHSEPGGRFRLQDKSLEDAGKWSWQQNPFVGTRPYQGLLVVLMMFASSDLKNDNNTLYELKTPRDGIHRWFVVRDLGTGLGETGRLAPRRDDPDLFERKGRIAAGRALSESGS